METNKTEKKIVAIGGGYDGIIVNGKKIYHETINIDKEIVLLSEKDNPNFLFLAHSKEELEELDCYEIASEIFGKLLKCSCKILRQKDLNNKTLVNKLINWADIIYEYGGNTRKMIELWSKTGFDKILKKAYEEGKVMCGRSAGANCWFKECNSDSLKIEKNQLEPLICVNGLSFINAFFTPHCDEKGRMEFTKNYLKNKKMVGISLSNCCAIEIVNNKYRIIKGTGNELEIEPYAIKSYWDNNEYIEKEISITNNFENINKIIKK